MNKFCSILLALSCIAVLFSGCASKGDSGTGGDGGNGQTPPEQTEDTYTYEEQIADAQAIHKNLMNAYFGIQEPTPSASALAYSAEKERSFEDMLEEICTEQEFTEKEMRAIYSSYFLLSHPLNELYSLYGTECLSAAYNLQYEIVNGPDQSAAYVLPNYIDFAGVIEEDGTKFALSYVEYEQDNNNSRTLQGRGYFKAYYNSESDYGYEISLFDTDEQGYMWGSMYSIHRAKNSVAVMRTELSHEPSETTYLLNNRIQWREHWNSLSDELKAATAEYCAEKNALLEKEIKRADEQNKVNPEDDVPEKSVTLQVDYKLIEAIAF